MTSSERNEERNFILPSIQVYRDHPALWEVNCDDYNLHGQNKEKSRV